MSKISKRRLSTGRKGKKIKVEGNGDSGINKDNKPPQ